MSRNLNGLKKSELIDILKNDYGYIEDDLKEDGKLYTNAKLRAIIEEEDLDEEDSERRKNMLVSERISIEDSDLITVMNGLSGSLTHRSLSTGRIWRFRSFGQTENIPYSELLTIRNNNPKVFDDCWLVILNPQVQEDFGLVDKYKNIVTPNNIDEIFKKDLDDLEVFVNNLPKGMSVTFFSIARDMYNDGKLDSIQKINFIQEKFDISFDDNAPLSDTV